MFVAHHHSLVRFAIDELLRRSGEARVVDTATKVPEVRNSLENQRDQFDCLVLELSLPEGSTLELVDDLREIDAEIPIIAMSVTGDAEHVARALRTGAAAYVGNGTGTDEIADAVKAVHNDRSFVSEELSEALALRGVFGPRAEPVSVLSNREYEVMKMIGAGTPISRIAHTLNLSTSTVNTHRQRIMKKLRITSAGELMRYAIEQRMSAGHDR